VVVVRSLCSRSADWVGRGRDRTKPALRRSEENSHAVSDDKSAGVIHSKRCPPCIPR